VKDEGKVRRRRGRMATTAAILDAAQELFAARGYDAVAVRDIAEQAGVTHALVHQYVGSKDDVFRAVLARREGLIVAAAPDNPDLLESAGLMLRHALSDPGQAHLRLIVRSALNGLEYERALGQFEATARLIELAEQASASAPSAERAAKDLDPRLVIACFVSLTLGWTAAQSWIRPAVGLQELDDAELIDGIERVMMGLLCSNVAGVGRDGRCGG
jgi:AcrR family transcriptional regulator